MSTKSANKRIARKTALKYTISETSPYRDSMYASRRNYGDGKSNDKI